MDDKNATDPTVRAAMLDCANCDHRALPFPTDRDNWALWICPDKGRWIYVEYELIGNVQKHGTASYHDTFVSIGTKMFKHWQKEPPEEGAVYDCTFVNMPGVPVCYGLFGGRFYVFTPKFGV